MMKRIFVSIVLITLTLPSVHGQERQLDTLRRKFDAYRLNALQEKIYAHTDRLVYLTGETMWFKLFCVDGTLHKPLNVSKVAYIEILDKANLPVLQAKVELKDGRGSGSLFIPASLSTGNYNFRVYTNWMKNFSPEFYFAETFTIINPFVKPELTAPKNEITYRADFFPEGGNLVAGIRSKIGFRITDNSGRGKNFQGYLFNASGDTLLSFVPAKFGMGHFFFTPSESQQYSVVIKDDRGRSSKHPFVKVNSAGYVMQLKDSGNFLNVKVTTKGVDEPFVYLFAHARQVVGHAAFQMLKRNEAVFSISKADLPEGITHITLFNGDLQPLCERLYFRSPEKRLDIRLRSNQQIYDQRRKVSIDIGTVSQGKTAAPANISMAVFRIDSLSTNERPGIYEYLWLGADLTGDIESPEYYLDAANPNVQIHIDNLMLTHGWRRFDWKDVLDKHPQRTHVPEHNGHIITGSVTKDGNYERGVLTYLASPGNIIRAYGSRSDGQGAVRYEIKDFYGPRKVIIQPHTDSADHYAIKINNPFSTAYSPPPPPLVEIPGDVKSNLLQRSIAMQVQDVYYYEQYGDRFMNPKIDSTAFYGKADATFFLDDYTRFQVMEEVMREYVPGVFVRKRRDGFHFIVVDMVHGGILSGDPMVLLDGVPVFDVDDIMAVDPLRIRKLEVVKRQYYFGPAVFSGIISYSTYPGDTELGGLRLNPQTITMNYDGLQLKREFHNPQYNTDQERNNRLPDQRYLLYWNADITTDAEGKQHVEFYTSDVEGNYIIMVEGLSTGGFAGSSQLKFSVKPSENP
jgi:hypothetical protein